MTIRAEDPERDAVSYSFVVVNSNGADSVLSYADTVVFYAKKIGLYNIQGRAHDSEGFSSRSWFIRVQDKQNFPPVITGYYPGSTLVQFGVGDTLLFDLEVDDDHPENLVYKYVLEDTTLQGFSKKSDLTYRFLENGIYDLTGIAWDGEYGDSITWNITISGEPDLTPPAGICDLEGRPGDERGTIFLKWTAPGDDGMEGRAAGYEARTSTVRITSEYEWKNSNTQPGCPLASAPGMKDSTVITSLTAGDYVYVCIRAYDDFFNLSPICSSPHVQVRGYDVSGKVIETETGDGVGDVIINSGAVEDTSSAGGYYVLENLTLQANSIFARDEISSGEIGDYHDYFDTFSLLSGDVELDLYLVPNYPLVSAEDQRYDNFMEFFRDLTNTMGNGGNTTIYKGWNHWPVTVYNPAITYCGVDLQAAADSAMGEWEEYTGIDLFEIFGQGEGSEPDVEIVYDFSVSSGKHHHIEVLAYNPDGTPSKKRMVIYPLITTPSIIAESHVIFTHEFGHIIGLDHSVDDGHIMIGLIFPKVDHVSEDEVHLVRTLYNLPFIFNSNSIKME